MEKGMLKKQERKLIMGIIPVLVCFVGLFNATLNCTAKYTINDNSTLKAVPVAPMKSINENRTYFENTDMKITSDRLYQSSFFGSLKIENRHISDLTINWEKAVFVDENNNAFPLGITRNTIIPPETSASISISVDKLFSKDRTTPFLPYIDKGSISQSQDVFSDNEALCACYTLGLYNLITVPFKYPAAKREAKKRVLALYDMEQLAIDAYNNKTIMLRIPYEVGGINKKVELRYRMVGKKEPYTEAN